MSNISTRNISRTPVRRKLFIEGYNSPSSLKHIARPEEPLIRFVPRRNSCDESKNHTSWIGAKLVISSETVLQPCVGDEAVSPGPDRRTIVKNNWSQFRKYEVNSQKNPSAINSINSSLRILNLDSINYRSPSGSKLHISDGWSELEELNDSLKQEFMKQRNKSKWSNL